MKNIRLAYCMTGLKYTWFWLGVWVLYYKGFGGYAAVGILETVMIVSAILAEIPTGAIGDMLGKRKTLIIAYLIMGVSQALFGVADTLTQLIILLVFLNIGYALTSGTFEAMLFDTLKEGNREGEYDKIIGNVTAINLFVIAFSGLIGGYLYSMNHAIPYFLNGLGMLVGMIFAFFLKEPIIDTQKFTISSYIRQNVDGARHLFRNPQIKSVSIGLLLIAFLTLIMKEGFNDILLVEYGFNETLLGVLSAIFALCGGLGAVWAGRVKESSRGRKFLLISTAIYALSLLASPFVGMTIGAVTILLRSTIEPIIDNRISGILNRNIESRYRATSLSTFAMLRGLPYAASIYLVSALADQFPATRIGVVLGILMLLALIVNIRLKDVTPDAN